MASLHFLHLSDDVYSIIQSYLTNDDYHYFINASKSIFHEIKRKTISFLLTKEYSKLFFHQMIFRERIYSLVSNPFNQILITLNLIDFLNPEVEYLRVRRIRCRASSNEDPAQNPFILPLLPSLKEVFLSNFGRMTNLSNLHNLHTARIYGCEELVDISSLQNVEIVELQGCTAIEDFRILGKQRVLDIWYSEKLVDVSNLANIYNLSLGHCPLLKDISPLCHVPILSLRSCPLIKDLSPLLGNHKELKIESCHYELEGYHILQNIPIVLLTDCNIVDVSVLSNAKAVELRNCNDLVDLSPLRLVKRIAIYTCPNVVNILPIAQAVELRLGEVPVVIEPNNEQKFTSLLSVNYTKSNNLLTLAPKIQKLNVFDSANFQFFQEKVMNFTNLQYLFVSSRAKFTTKGLTNIPKINFSYCANLQDLTGLGMNREVRLFRCHAIRNVKSLSNVPIVTIIDCNMIKDYSCLAKVPRLKVFKWKDE